MNAIEIIKSQLPSGSKVQAELVYDPDAANPRECDNLGTILIAPNKAHWIASPDSVADTSIALGNNPYDHWENLRREQLKLKKSDIAIAYPVTNFEHGEISLSLGYTQGLDYGVVGFVYVTKEQLRKCYGVNRITKSIIERAKTCLQAELDLLAAWLNGECYGWQVKEYALTDDGLDWEEVGILDSCWGYLDKEQASCDMKDMLITICQSSNQNQPEAETETETETADTPSLQLGLPFMGFYESYHTAQPAQIMERELYDKVQTITDAQYDDVWCAFDAEFDYKKYHQKVANLYARWLIHNLYDVTIAGVELHCPREHNFTTDTITVILNATPEQLDLTLDYFKYNPVDNDDTLLKETLAYIKEKYTSRAGFISLIEPAPFTLESVFIEQAYRDCAFELYTYHKFDLEYQDGNYRYSLTELDNKFIDYMQEQGHYYDLFWDCLPDDLADYLTGDTP